MRCPNCGAEGTKKFCEYCGAQMPQENNAGPTIINNYYTNVNPNNMNPGGYNQGYNQGFNQGYNEGLSQGFISPKSRLVALLLCFFLGGLGIHYFYAGRLGMGIVYLVTGGLFGIGWFVDFFRILLGAFPDNYGRKLTRW